MSAGAFTKHPIETYPIGIDYSGKAPTGAVLLNGVWSAIDLSNGTDVSSVVLASTTGVIAGTIVKCRIQDGTLDHSYRIGVTVTFDTGDVLHDNVYMTVTEDG